MSHKLKFEIENAEIISEEPSSQFATAKITAFSDGVSRHDTICDEETLRKTAHTIYETPIVYEYDKRFGDFGSHTENPVIAGFVVPNSAEFYKRDDGSNRTSMSITAKIWKRYSSQFLDIFRLGNSKKRSVSVEMEVYDSEEDGNLLRLKDWAYTAVCVLGELVTPASPSAELEMISFAEKSNEDYEKAYNLEFGKYDSLNFKIPKQVKENAQEGLDLHKKYGRGGTSVGWATARYLIKNDVASPEKVRHVAKYFSRHANDNLDDKKSNGWIAWMIWGSDAGRKWSSSLVKKMDELDKKKLSYYAEEDEMPYKSMDEVNPSIKGIEPSVTLSQANEIAKQAEAVGTDEEKNGWAIAISSFKKSHEVKDGKWVKKEEQMSEFAKEDWGKGDALEVDKSKDSMSDSAWGDVDKTELRNKILDASNYKSLVKDVYMLVEDGWEDSPSSHLKYPVMQISGGKLVYNRYGLSAALQRAEGQNESSVVSKVHSIYEKLEINKEEGGNTSMAEEDKAKFNYAEIFADENFANMFAEVEVEVEDEEPEEGEKESYSAAKEEFAGEGMNPSHVMKAMYSAMKRMGKRMMALKEKMAKMEEDKDVYMAENAEMKQRFAEQEEKQKDFAVEAFLNDISQKVRMPEGKRDEMKEKAKNFAFANLDNWKNECKAESFDFEKISNEEGREFISYAFPFDKNDKPQNDNVWDELQNKK